MVVHQDSQHQLGTHWGYYHSGETEGTDCTREGNSQMLRLLRAKRAEKGCEAGDSQERRARESLEVLLNSESGQKKRTHHLIFP